MAIIFVIHACRDRSRLVATTVDLLSAGYEMGVTSSPLFLPLVYKPFEYSFPI